VLPRAIAEAKSRGWAEPSGAIFYSVSFGIYNRSADRSDSLTIPTSWGSLPSIASLTMAGARKASEIVMLTWRMLQPSRAAISSIDRAAPVTSSFNQARPLAMDVTSRVGAG